MYYSTALNNLLLSNPSPTQEQPTHVTNSPFISTLYLKPLAPHPWPKQPPFILILGYYVIPQYTKSSQNSFNCPNNSPKTTAIDPPPHPLHVDSHPKTSKIPNSNSPQRNLFVNQREFPKFPQNSFIQLVTQFPVCLRELPFSELGPKTQKPKLQSNFHSNPQKLASFHGPIIKGRRADLIFYRHPFQLTYFPISFFIQNPFSHKFLKLF
jgi:hypothetical protein